MVAYSLVSWKVAGSGKVVEKLSQNGDVKPVETNSRETADFFQNKRFIKKIKVLTSLTSKSPVIFKILKKI